MNDSNASPLSRFNRRNFLRTAVGISAATMTYSGQLSRVAEARSPDLPNEPDDHWTAGTLVAVDAHEISVRTMPDAEPIRLRLTADTHFCRQHCDYDVERLRLGDRVECGVVLSVDGVLTAQFVNANAVYGHGKVTNVESTAITLEDDHQIDRLLKLEIGSWSHVVSADGFDVTADFTSWTNVGDFVFFTATGSTPDRLSGELWGYIVSLQANAGAGPEARLGELR